MTMTGHCLCGQFSYSAEGEPQMTLVCHCDHCQRQSGSAFSIIVGVPDAAITSEGALKSYEDHGESGNTVERKFCPDCGSPVLTTIPAMPGMTWIKAGTLDERTDLEPQMHIWCQSAQGWAVPEDGKPHFEKNPG
jgi:hypothetical protein